MTSMQFTALFHLPIEMEYEFSAGCPARFDGHPDTWEPADPAEIVITKVAVYGHDILPKLSADQLKQLEELCTGDMDEREQVAIESLADRRAEDRF